ncbi:MAG: ATP-binding protein [Lachnospiraceae bacterium]|nr:ATP-binding protein [Lachnospiraceae bacterium]
MVYVQSFLILVLEILCCKIFYETFAERRRQSKALDGVVLAALASVGFLAVNLLSQKLIPKTVAAVFIIAAAMYVIFRITFVKSVILSALFQALTMVVDYLALLTAVGLFGSTKEIEKTHFIEGTLTIVLSKAILFLCVVMIRRVVGKKDAALLKDTEWLKFIFFPLFSICTLLGMIRATGGMKNQKAEEICVIVAIGLVGMNIVVFYLIRDILERESKVRENQLLRMQVDAQTELYRSISENLEKQRRKTHEYKNQILCIDALVENKSYTELEKYVRKISGGLNKELDVINTNHALINAIINTKYQEAVNKDILFVVRIGDLSDLGMRDEDIVVILSNLLDNAIEACETCDKRIIRLKFVKDDGNIVISVKNTFQGTILCRNGEIATTKKDVSEHGIGIRNIVHTVHMYGGSYTIKYDQEEFYFSILIPNDGEHTG